MGKPPATKAKIATGKAARGTAASSSGEGRMARRRRDTRARLLAAAYEVMAETGVDIAKVKDITDRADVGFGTFYNYFETKDELASQVLDCVIRDLGRRNMLATRMPGWDDPALIMPVSIRLMMQAIVASPMWHWWVLRPDLLADRMRLGFGPFAMRDMAAAMESGFFKLREEDIPATWALAVWVMVGGLHDVVVGGRAGDNGTLVAETVMRMMGVPIDDARRVASTELPAYPESDVDWTFRLAISE